MTPIYSDDVEAVEKLRAKLARLKNTAFFIADLTRETWCRPPSPKARGQ